ncbi:MAG: hypothetical protein ACI94Y_000978 [Maribacter sp.]|jgi:hypothetical protein
MEPLFFATPTELRKWFKKMEGLEKDGLLHPRGIAVYALREENNSKQFAYEQKIVELKSEYLKK